MIRFLSVFVVLAAACMAQTELAAISTASIHPVLTPDSPDHTFGVEMDPDGVHCYVTVSGALGAPGSTGFMNNQVLKIDLIAEAIVGQAIVGFYPEDIVIRTNSAGQTETIFVSAASSGTVTALDASLGYLGDVNLGNCWGYSMFPFEMVLSPSGGLLYVGSNCAGDIFEVIADPTDPNFLGLSTALTYNEAHSTLNIVNSPTGEHMLVVGGSVSDVVNSTWLGSHSVIDVIDFTTQLSSGTTTTYHVGAGITGDWASTTDVLPLPNSQLLIVENSQTRANLYIFDLNTLSVVKTHNLQAQVPGLAYLHQANIDTAGRIVTVTSLDADIIFFDLTSGNVVSKVHYTTSVQPSIAKYTNAGDKLVCTYQNEEVVRVFGSLPVGLSLTVNGNTAIDSSFTMNSEGAMPFGLMGTAFSSLGNTPSMISGFVVSLTPPIGIFSLTPCNAMGAATQFLSVPNDPNLVGLTGYFQGFTGTPAGSLALSNPLTITVLP